MIQLVKKVKQGNAISLEDARFICETPEDELCSLLWGADQLRRDFFDTRVKTCAIVNAKCGLCSEDCSYCAQSAHFNTETTTYPLMDKEELLKAAQEAEAKGVNRFSFVTSGRGLNDTDIDRLCEAVQYIRSQGVQIPFCVSLGILTLEQFKKLHAAGIERYHHNLESNANHFSKVCTTHTYEDRVRTVRFALATGMDVCSGGLFGLGESWDDRIELAFAVRELDVTSVPLNFLSPIPGTPAEKFPSLSAIEMLKIIVLFRFVNPTKEIRICGGRESGLKDMQSLIFFAGADGVMVGNYLVTAGRGIDDDFRMVTDLGLKRE